MKLTAKQMRSLLDFFTTISDPRHAQGRRHSLPGVLAIAAGSVLCGMRGYKALSPTARARIGCYFSQRNNSVLSERIRLSRLGELSNIIDGVVKTPV